MGQFRIENILVAVDMSDYSELVVGQARKLAKFLKKPLTFVHVISKKIEDSEQKNIESSHLLQLYAERIQKMYHLQNDERVRIRVGKPHLMVLETAAEYAFPMIVAGHRGGHPIAKFFLGSVIQKLALFSPFPVWIHRGEKEIWPLRIMVPCTLDDHSLQVVQGAKEIAHLFQSQLELFHVMPMPSPAIDVGSYGLIYSVNKEIDENQVLLFKQKYPDLKLVSTDGDPTHEIRKRAQQFDLVILTPSYREKEVPFFGTVATHLVSSGHTPFLILPGLAIKRTSHSVL